MPGFVVAEADYDEAMALFLSPLRLTQLNGNLGPTLTALPPTHPLFADMTHLGLRNWHISGLVDIEDTRSHVSFMPRLTHLSFEDGRFIPHCTYILETCRLLHVLISLSFDSELSLFPDELEDLSRDPRFVVMQNGWHLQDWQMGIHAGVDYWTRAEDFIAKRRCKEIDPLGYKISGDASEYIAARYASSTG
ncbi:hypothetical protein MVEN_00282100 [Mycena venus]|uniref:Uncharacterized protein n=1 Tax=Mycena venus TaxID=2733690 RepID=A0A8H7DET0_9AGAR|nr:hypothetical protein MVEN_00282100 [Mycena venus]